MDAFSEFLTHPLFTLYQHTYSVGQVLVVPIVVLLGLYLIARLEALLLRRLNLRGRDKNIVLLLQRLYFVFAYLALLLLVLSLLRIPLTAFAFVSGAVAIGVGFGAQNIINNFISGWILMWERPIRIGDILELGDMKGTVETINTRSIRLRRVDGVHMLVPNSQLLENTIINWTLIDRMVRGMLRLGVAYGSDVRLVETLIYQAVNEHPDISPLPDPAVFFEDFGSSALIFEVYFWVDTGGDRDMRRIRSDLRYTINELFAKADIVLAFPQLDVHLDGSLLTQRPRESSGE